MNAVQSVEVVQESENEQRIILNSMLIGVIVIDPLDHTIALVNSEAALLIGTSVEKTIGTKCHQLFCRTEDGKCPLMGLDQKIENDEQVLITTSGSEIPVLKTIVPIQLKGRTHYLETFIDISKWKEIEKGME